MALAGIKICMDSKDMASKVLMEAMGSNNEDMANKVMTNLGTNKVTDSSRLGGDSSLNKVMVSKDGVDSNLSKVMQALVVDMVAKANNLLVPVDMELKTRLLDMALLRVVQVVDMALLKVVQVVDMVPLKVMVLIMGHKLTTVLMLVVMVMEDNPLKTTIMEVAMDKVLVAMDNPLKTTIMEVAMD